MTRKATLAELLDADQALHLADLCRLCGVSAEWIMELVDDGIVEPLDPAARAPRFSGVCVRRVQIVRRLQRDLGVNRAGAGLALELLEEISELRSRLRMLEGQFPAEH
jgi:chaperone modulatory protein CbpM